MEPVQTVFPYRASKAFLSRVDKNNPHDPLLKQILPMAEEETLYPGYTTDPLNEKLKNPVPGLLHKYHGRVLLITTQKCPIHCRYCFRRHFNYEENSPQKKDWSPAIQYIANDPSITEIILSGGDPLMLKNPDLQHLIQLLESVPHLKTLRIHTRTPIAIPKRINKGLIDMLSASRFHIVIVLHCNHPNEIDNEVENTLKALKRADFILLNQSVLLKGINDDATVLRNLSECLFQNGVLPYYLHLLDPVQGSTPF